MKTRSQNSTVKRHYTEPSDSLEDKHKLYHNNISSEITKKSPRRWTEQEDQILLDFKNKNDFNGWKGVRNLIPYRTVRQCRERYRQYLSQKQHLNSTWTDSEVWDLGLSVMLLGHRWTEVRKYIPSKTKAQIKNYYNSKVKPNNAQIQQHVRSQLSKVYTMQKDIDECQGYTKSNAPLYISLLSSLMPEQMPRDFVPFTWQDVLNQDSSAQENECESQGSTLFSQLDRELRRVQEEYVSLFLNARMLGELLEEYEADSEVEQSDGE